MLLKLTLYTSTYESIEKNKEEETLEMLSIRKPQMAVLLTLN